MTHVLTDRPTQERAPMLVPHLGDMTALAREQERRMRVVQTALVLAEAGTCPAHSTECKLHALMQSAAEVAGKPGPQKDSTQQAYFLKAATRWPSPKGGNHAN